MSSNNENRVFTPENIEGEILSGCKVLHKLAIGGMGTIYKARQLSMNRDVAIKVLSDELSKDRAYVQRFILEARAAGELSHTNLIHVIDVGTYHNLYYYVMEFVDGEGLDAVLEKRGNLPPGESVEIVLQVGSALDHAHRKGIIHRDIKPDNIILMANGQIKLADLGIAKRVTNEQEGITQPGMVLGTPFYMAPEQGKDSRLVDRRSDVYALGASFYHMLSGQVPFDGKTCLEVVLKAIEARPIPLLRIKENLPPRVVAICEKMMQKEPDDRYQTATEVIQDLERVKAGLDPFIAPMPGITARAAMPRSVAAPVQSAHAEPAPRKPAPAPTPAPAAASEELFEVEDLDLGDTKGRSPGRPTPAKAAAPKPASTPAAAARSASPQKPTGSGGGDLFEIDDLAVPVHKAEKEEASAPERPSKRSVRDLDPDVAPRRPMRKKQGPGSTPAVHTSIEEDPEEDGRPSQQQVMSALSSHGSINPAARAMRTEGERGREKLIPAITLSVGIIAILLGGIWLLKSDKSGGKTDKDGTFGKHTDPVDTGGTAATASDSPESRAALESAEQAVQQHPEDYVRNITAYQDVIDNNPTSEAAKTAKTLRDAMQKKLDLGATETFAKIESQLEPARTQHAYGAILEALRIFREEHATKEWLAKADTVQKPLTEEATKYFDETMTQATALESTGNIKDAMALLEGLLDLGIPDPVEQVNKRLPALSNRHKKLCDDARQIFTDKYLNSESVKENASKRRFQLIESQLDSYLKDRAMRPLLYSIETELESVRNARKLMDGFANSIGILSGKPESIKLAKSVRKGEIVKYEDEKIFFKVSGHDVSAALADVIHEEVIRIALISLGANKAESHILIGGYYQTLGMLDEAQAEIQAAASMGGDIRIARASLEEAQLQKRILAGSHEVDLMGQTILTWNIPTPGMTYEPSINALTSSQGKGIALIQETPWVDYVWTMRARKTKGLNGFLIAFQMAGQFYTWAMGDEQNTCSWVRGFPDTKTADKVANNRWYDIKVVVVGQCAWGYVDGARKWRIEVAQGAIPAVETPGMGVGYAFGMVTYQDLKLLELKK